ncbi:MAG: transposase [Bryobacteraceae bacterium]|nr:transposase [Bryobacteraceae bacterium]
MILRKGYKFRLKTKYTHEGRFRRFCGHCRFVWNKALALQLGRLASGTPLLSYRDLAGLLKLWKQSEEYGFLKEAHSQALQQTLKDLDRALWDGLKKAKGMPQFRKKGKQDSFRYPQGFKINGSRIYLPKIGWVGYRQSRDIQGEPKNVTVSRRGRHWFMSIQAEREVPAPVHPSTSAVGIDLGVSRFATLSDGTVYEPLNSFRRLEKKLAREQRRLSRKSKFSKNWRKQKEKITRLHIRIADARQDYLHQASTEISKNHAVVVMEDLRVKNMSASAKGSQEHPGRNVRQKAGLNKAILDQGWYEFRRQLSYKLAWAGGVLEFVPPHYTSQTCPECDFVSSDNRRSQALFRCEACGFEDHADHVASINILRRAGHARIACSEPLGFESQAAQGSKARWGLLAGTTLAGATPGISVL